MGERLQGKVAIVVGAGSTPGETLGNGRATAILFAREGASVLLVDRDADSAQETQGMIADEGCQASVCQADVTRGEDCRRMAESWKTALDLAAGRTRREGSTRTPWPLR